MQDLTIPGHVEDARHQFIRAVSNDDLASWAKRWGESAIEQAERARAADEVAESSVSLTSDEYDDAVRNVERAVEALQGAEKLMEGERGEADLDKVANPIIEAITKLEKVDL
jgi:glutamyl-tRNA reductase